jgi:hypothetical protein
MSKPASSHHLLYFMLRAQQLANKESLEGGYAMMIVSIVTVMMFSLLAAYLTITNITKSATNAYTEGNSTFYAAESGLNQRSDAVRQKFVNYATPTGVSPGAVAGKIAGPENMANCLDSDATNDGSGDFGCQKLELNYNHSTGTNMSSGADGKSQTATDYNNNIKYNAYTFTSDRTTYTDPVRKIPQVQTIPAGQVYAGLNAQEYKYTVYSMATSKQPGDLDARATTILEMTFKDRNIPLFQFAAFYNGDLEMNSTSQMDINGRVHTNRNLYIQPTPDGTTANTRLLGQVTAANHIYNRVDASDINRHGITNVLLTGDPNNPNAATNTYGQFPEFIASRETPLTVDEITAFRRQVLDGATGATTLTIPPPGFLRKRDPSGDIGEYYGKADLRLEMVPKRAAGNVPFNFAAIRSSGTGGGSCSTFEISVGRQGTINCNQLNEGQRRSLQQPVMAKVVTTAERDRLCSPTTKIHTSTSLDENKILRALQVAIAAQNTPVSWDQLNSSLNETKNASISSIAISLNPSLDVTKSPIDLAAAQGACFLPPPIQLLTGPGSGPNPNYSWESNYFDRREERWIGMLQTNIGSLTVWNRDGLYVGRDDTIATNDDPTSAQTTAAFNGGIDSSAYDTDSILFARAAAHAAVPTTNPIMSFFNFQPTGLGTPKTQQLATGFNSGRDSENILAFYKGKKNPKNPPTTTTPIPPTTPTPPTSGSIRSLHQLGFGASDTTEGGLVFHATVSDDFNDDGTPDVTVNAIDKLREYADGKKKSSYGFAFSDGDDLPGPLTIVTDRALYVQGDYNNFNTNLEKQPAALIGDTITVLSNKCDGGDKEKETQGMINCGVKDKLTLDASATTINAAFLSYTDPSDGNIGSSGYPSVHKYSGGLNNYMRMVEDWGGIDFNYTGSFVSLGTPQEYSGVYHSGGGKSLFVSGGNYYNVPNRNFNYETDFNAFDKLPPLTPKVIYLQQETFRRSYK